MVNKQKLYDKLNKNIISPQSHLGVLECGLDILDLFKPKSVLEIGFGRGDWSLAAAMILEDNSVNFNGIDNFSGIVYGKENGTEEKDWPDTIGRLQKHVNIKKTLIGVANSIKVYEGDVTNKFEHQLQKLDTKFDCIRLDCLCSSRKEIINLLETVLKFTDERFIIFLDDAVPSCCVQRFLAAIDLTENKQIKPIWFSEDETAFVNPNFDSKELITEFKKIKERRRYFLKNYLNYVYLDNTFTPIIRSNTIKYPPV